MLGQRQRLRQPEVGREGGEVVVLAGAPGRGGGAHPGGAGGQEVVRAVADVETGGGRDAKIGGGLQQRVWCGLVARGVLESTESTSVPSRSNRTANAEQGTATTAPESLFRVRRSSFEIVAELLAATGVA